jgi:D-tyrosyl-tRNA(Tyr) deacylase
MKIVVQAVRNANVEVAASEIAVISFGLVLLVGIEAADSTEVADKVINKLLKLRLFKDPLTDKYFDKNLVEVDADVLVVSNFTVPASLKSGNRPDFSVAMSPKDAENLYSYFVQKFKDCYSGVVESGQFGANMQVSLVNDGPITICLDSEQI